jgi:hypothetical protein
MNIIVLINLYPRQTWVYTAFITWKWLKKKKKKQSKAVLLLVMQMLRGRGSIAPTHSWPQHYMGVSQCHAPAALYPWKRTAGTHWIGGYVGFRAGLDSVARRKILFLYWESNPGPPVCSQTLYWLSYPSSHLKVKVL